jgi:hypothetical protein
MSINPYGGYGSNIYGSNIYGGSTGASSALASNAGTSSDIQFGNNYQTESTPPAQSAGGGEQKSSGGIGGFFKGIFNGAKNAVKSLFTPKGLLLAAAGIGACILFPIAAPLILGGLAVTAGGYQMYKGAKNGSSEQMGEGFFTAGTGALGVAGSGAIGAARGGSAGTGAGAGAAGSETGTATGSSGGLWSSIKSGLSKLNPFSSSKEATPMPSNPIPSGQNPPPSTPVPVNPAANPAPANTATTNPATIPGTPAPVNFAENPAPVKVPTGAFVRNENGALVNETRLEVPTNAFVKNENGAWVNETVPYTPSTPSTGAQTGSNAAVNNTPRTIPGTPAPVNAPTTNAAPETIPGTPAPVNPAASDAIPGTPASVSAEPAATSGTKWYNPRTWGGYLNNSKSAAPASTADDAANTGNAAKTGPFADARAHAGDAWRYMSGTAPEAAGVNPFLRPLQVAWGKAPGQVSNPTIGSVPAGAVIGGSNITNNEQQQQTA